MGNKYKTIVIPRQKLWETQASQDRKVNAAIEKMERKGYRYVSQQMEWSGLRLNFQRGS